MDSRLDYQVPIGRLGHCNCEDDDDVVDDGGEDDDDDDDVDDGCQPAQLV